MLPTYLEHLAAKGRSQAYIDKQRRILGKLIPDPQGQLDELAARATETTLRDHLNRLRCYGAWLERQGHSDPYKGISLAEAAKPPRSRTVITYEEVKRLTSCADIPAERRALWLILSHTGLRPIEASRVRPSHLSKQYGRWVLVLPGSKTKNGKPTNMVLCDSEAELIRKHCPLIRGVVDKLYRSFRRDMATAGVPLKKDGVNRTPYDLRCFFITHLHESGASDKKVSELARHASIKTTERHYIRYHNEEMLQTRREALNLL